MRHLERVIAQARPLINATVHVDALLVAGPALG